MSIVVIFAGLGGVVFQFIWRPMQHFLALRTEITRQTVAFKIERARWKVTQCDGEPLHAKGVERRLQEAQREFRDLAEQMRLFGETEHLATWVLRKLHYDPIQAETGLSALADAIALERSGTFEAARSESRMPHDRYITYGR
jgi:hypothetical protein